MWNTFRARAAKTNPFLVYANVVLFGIVLGLRSYEIFVLKSQMSWTDYVALPTITVGFAFLVVAVVARRTAKP